MSDLDLECADRYRRVADRRRSLLGAVLLRQAVSQLIGVAPAAVVMERRCPRGHTHHGRPVFPEDGVFGSISHSGGFVAVACSVEAPVGVDLERVPAVVDPAVVRRITATGEASPRDGAAFSRAWVRKESVVKATGDGLACPFSSVRLDDADPGVPRLVSYRGEQLDATLTDLAAPHGYRAALTLLAPPPSISTGTAV